VAWKKFLSHINDIKGWVATITYIKYFNLDAPKAPEHDFVMNPLVYIGYQDQLLEAKEPVVKAYVFRATQETYFTI